MSFGFLDNASHDMLAMNASTSSGATIPAMGGLSG